jgi:hypothetical protein
VPEAVVPKGQEPPPDIVRKLSDKLTQLFGNDTGEGFVQEQGARGEVGLPLYLSHSRLC